MSRMWVLALAGAVLLVPPLTAQASEFCPPPQAPPGFSLTPDGRAFHGAPTIERLQIGTNTAIPCRAIRDSPGSLCGSYQLRYFPWDPYPQLAILRIMNSVVAYHAVIERQAAAAGLALGGEKVETEHGRDCGSLLRGCRGPPFRTSCRLPATGSTSPAPWRRPP